MKYVILTILLLIPSFLYSQYSINGCVTEEDGKTPMPYVTVYINGTTNGTYTNEEGYFTLFNENYPCLLVISHVGYETKTVRIGYAMPEMIAVRLKSLEFSMPEVIVEGENQKEKNMQIFGNFFLGTDKYGKKLS